MIFVYQHEFLDEEIDDFILHINRLEPYLYYRNLVNIYTFVSNAKYCTDRNSKLKFMKSVIDRRVMERVVDKEYGRNIFRNAD